MNISPHGIAGSVQSRWRRGVHLLVRGFHAYARWLVSISWKRFFLLAVLLLIAASVLEDLPPFRWKVREVIEEVQPTRGTSSPGSSPTTGKPAELEKNAEGVDISIDSTGIRVTPRRAAKPDKPASAPADSTGADATPSSQAIHIQVGEGNPAAGKGAVQITLPPGEVAEEVRAAVEEATREVEEAIKESRNQNISSTPEHRGRRVQVRTTHLGDFLGNLALLWILASIIIKITYKSQMQAQAQAAAASETAEAEQLRRQVAEARLAAMQAQVEPHFLFNTLASIEHLIETDPARAGQMQRSLIALLRATMPTLRETGSISPRTLGQELEVVQAYLAILKVRMEDRLETHIQVPEGLLSAEFPPMMLQGLVENAVKHGLEPKPEGGSLRVSAEIDNGNLRVVVSDSGVGLYAEKAVWADKTQAGKYSGLQNMRERLALLHGSKASLEITEGKEGGVRAVVTLPYRVVPAGPQPSEA